MKSIKYILYVFVLAVFFVGCEAETPGSDPEAPASTAGYPTPTFTLSAGTLTTNESDETTIVYDIVMDKPIGRGIDFSWVILDSSTATEHDDFDVIGGSIPAYQTTGQLMIKIYNDVIVEGTETLNLTIQSGPSLANTYLVNPRTVYPTVNVQIQDYLFCLWTLETSDTYGDGWQGAVIELLSDGVTTEYSPAPGADPTIFDVPVGLGSDYTFTYVSGGGTGGAPGYENENYYKLTAPNGTVFEGGTQDYSGIPTPGVITSGTSNCN